MFDTKFLSILFALIIGIVAICKLNNKEDNDSIIEQYAFNGNPGKLKPNTFSAVQGNNGLVALQPSNQNSFIDTKFVSNPQFQSNIPPRFQNLDFGANILYNLPSTNVLAADPKSPFVNNSVPYGFGYPTNTPASISKIDPMLAAEIVKENYEGNNLSCKSGGIAGGPPFHETPIMGASYANGDFNQVSQQLYNEAREQNNGYGQAVDMVPIGSMTALTGDGQQVEVVQFNQGIMSLQQNTRLRSQGDPIRGDLPITPCNTGWFQVSVNPVVDLQQGAMFVMGGMDNELTKQMAALLANSSYNTTTSGIQLNSAQLESINASAAAEVSVQATV